MRRDISLPQQLVQAAHAALEAGFSFDKPPETSFLVMLGVENQQKLIEAATRLKMENIRYELFYEPDDDMGYSALATEPLTEDRRRIFRRYKLWT